MGIFVINMIEFSLRAIVVYEDVKINPTVLNVCGYR